MTGRKTILVVDDNLVNRQLLCKILSAEYDTVQADNGECALSILKKEQYNVDVILLDIVMPVMDGYEFLKAKAAVPKISNIPVIVTTQQESEDSEVKALSLGAYDFLTKPYRPTIIRQRVVNILKFRETASMMNAVERDALTGLYNKDAFYQRASEMMMLHADNEYVLITYDIERFKLINDLFGIDEGDKLLKYMSRYIRDSVPSGSICGRLSGDVFVSLIQKPPKHGFSRKYFETLTNAVKEYPLNIDISIKLGIYYVSDLSVSVNAMCDRAKLAAESVKGKYDILFACYDDSLRNALLEEQQILNDMKNALSTGQFEVYYQPKYDLETENIAGAEALVRWRHPEKGFLSPAQFIPLFEKNGFITDLDIFVWNSVCEKIRSWTDARYSIVPISVNVSRVDIYNPNLADILTEIVKKHGLTTKQLHLEITETAYTESPKQIIETVRRLHELGFIIEMDDFGTGYSSLNMLNELPLDTLKLDMRFLQNHSIGDRKGNILNFVVSLAKWLGLTVVAEGVETHEQVLFLRSMSCNLGQGYYFSKPMPENDFTRFIASAVRSNKTKAPVNMATVKIEDIWNPLSQFNELFNSYIGAMGIYEYTGETLSLIRGNDKFYSMLETTRELLYKNACNILDYAFDEDREIILDSINSIKDGAIETDSYSRWYVNARHERVRWLHVKLKVLQNADDRLILLSALDDITQQKELEQKLIQGQEELRRQREFFERIYDFAPCGMAQFTASDGFICTRVNNAMVRMLGFDSTDEFFKSPRKFLDFVVPECRERVGSKLPKLVASNTYRNSSLEYGLMAHNHKRMWVKTSIQVMHYGDEKTFQCAVTDITNIKRTESRLRETAQRDSLTGLLNRSAFEDSVSTLLGEGADARTVFLMADIDDFKQINDTYGHIEGDSILKKMAGVIKKGLGNDDIIARLGGDEFAVLVRNIPAGEDATVCCDKICERLAKHINDGTGLTCSIGAAIFPLHGNSFNELYGKADTALYKAKERGKNRYVVYDL